MTFEEILVFLSSQGNLAFTCTVVLSYLLLESFYPLFAHRVSPAPRWLVNVSIHVINSVMAYLVLIYMFDMRLEEEASSLGFGLFSHFSQAPLWLQFVVFTLVADFSFYWLHRAYHTWSPLWRIHVVHHSDVDVDLTDSFRIHPFQSLAEIILRLSITLLLGVPLIVLILYNVIYQVFVFYPHANVRLPRKIERILRLFVVTSDMHRIHHSSSPLETNSNYGDIFPWWDHLFGTFRFLEWDEQEKMELGLEYFRRPEECTLAAVLMQPITYDPVDCKAAEQLEKGEFYPSK